MNPEPTRVLVSMPDRFLKAVDAQVKQEGQTRSEYVRKAMSYYMQEVRRQRREELNGN